MKKLSFKIGALMLAFTVLFSSLSIGIDKHYCGDMLFSKAIFLQAEDCGMEMATACPGHSTSEQYVQQESCCHDVQIIIEGNDVNQTASQLQTLKTFKVLVPLNIGINFALVDTQKHLAFYKDYAPPLIVQDIPVLIQSFLI